jgi:hypothetical protein
MSLTVSPPVATYLNGSNAFDALAAAQAFAANAVVHDEGRERRGHDAVLEWLHEVIAAYQAKVEPISFDEKSGVLTGRVSGEFPGSPIVLRYAFTLADGKIAALRISS